MLCCLVVDDSDIIRKVARSILEDMHYLVLEAENAQVGLDQVTRAMPDVILLDWLLPDMSGHEFLAAFESIQAEKKAPVIYLTTENDAADLALALGGGAADFMMKPFDRGMLRDKILKAAVLAA